jgi:hypothetical protein
MKKPYALLHMLLMQLIILVMEVNDVKNINISSDFLLQEDVQCRKVSV